MATASGKRTGRLVLRAEAIIPFSMAGRVGRGDTDEVCSYRRKGVLGNLERLSEDRYNDRTSRPAHPLAGRRKAENHQSQRSSTAVLPPSRARLHLVRSAIAAELLPDHDAEKARANLRRLVADTRGLIEGTGVLLQSGEFGQVTLAAGQGHIESARLDPRGGAADFRSGRMRGASFRPYATAKESTA
ncbi:hypothetical protein U1Q18_052119 [Sarracenia purpurea var. burkii]